MLILLGILKGVIQVKMLFDSMILDDGQLGEVQIEASTVDGKFDVVSHSRGNSYVLKTFDSEVDAQTWLSSLADKLAAEEGISTLDFR